MDKINGKDIARELDMYGDPIDPQGTYVVDHINGLGEPEYVTAEAWNNSSPAAAPVITEDNPFRYLF